MDKINKSGKGKQTVSYLSSDIFETLASVDPKCIDEQAKLFVNYACYVKHDDLVSKRIRVKTLSCIAVFAVFVYLAVIHYFKNASTMK